MKNPIRAAAAVSGVALALATACTAILGATDVPMLIDGGTNGDGMTTGDGSGSGSSSGSSSGSDAGSSSGSGSGASSDSGSETSPDGPDTGPLLAIGTVSAPDCAGCTFPPATANPCPSTAPAIKLVYPNDNVLVPPNLNVVSVQWTPYGSTFTQFSVDFSNPPNTDWHIITACQNQTIDAQSGTPSGGCEVTVDPTSWSALASANRGRNPIIVTVRGTINGNCASASTNAVHISFAEEDLLGKYYYWKSTVSPNATGGQIWKKTFGDLSAPESNVTAAALPTSTCNGCHALSRDGSRMVVYSDDNDSDDEYSDVTGSYLDMTTNPATEFPGGLTGVYQGGQPPGFSAIDPAVTVATTPTAPGYYVTSNGYPCVGAGACGTSNGYPSPVPTNGFSVWNGTTGAFIDGVTIGAANARPTMPDWSPDGQEVVYVVPAREFTWRQDDAHIYGGSLYTVPYMGNGTFGAPSLFLASNGENNYYPSYSPDVPMSYVIFNRVDNMNAGAMCNGGFCPDDSFSNPAARLLLIAAPGGPQVPAGGTATPIDLEKANGSPITGKLPWSNSYPRWAPFVQKYKGNTLLWFTFSSTRDYGLRVLNHKTGMYQCYPSDSAMSPGAPHVSMFAPGCQEPQLWMAAISPSAALGSTDPSAVAFWIPYQDITTHNHTAQWAR